MKREKYNFPFSLCVTNDTIQMRVPTSNWCVCVEVAGIIRYGPVSTIL